MKIKNLLLTLVIGMVLLGACTMQVPSPVPQEIPNIAPPPMPRDTSTSRIPNPVSTATLSPSPALQESPSASTPATSSAPTPSPTPATTMPTPSPKPAGPYAGPLFDTHFHLGMLSSRFKYDKNLLFGYLDRGKVDWALGFYSLPTSRWYPEAASTEYIISTAGNRIVPLIMPAMADWKQFASGQYNEEVLRQYLQPKGRLWGVGEIPLFQPDLQSVTLDSPQMQTVLKIVNELKGIVMIHPSNTIQGGRAMDLAEIEAAIRKYPDTIFLFHYFLNPIVQLMSKYSNVYYSMDAATTFLDVSWDTPEDFQAYVNRVGFEGLVQGGLSKVSSQLQLYPDRIFWGTDLWLPWHLDNSVTDVVIRISREIIGRLPADLQEKYAYKNALNVFGRFLTTKP